MQIFSSGPWDYVTNITNWGGIGIPARYRAKVQDLVSSRAFCIDFSTDSGTAACWYNTDCDVRVVITVYEDSPGGGAPSDFDPNNPPGGGTIPPGAKKVHERQNIYPVGTPNFSGTGFYTSNTGMQVGNAGASGFTWPAMGWVVAQVMVAGLLCPRRWFWRISF